MQRVGMVVDLSHTGRKSSLQALELAERPMMFSHSNVDTLVPHPRNLTDEQIRACAATGGVVGLSASSDYLGDLETSAETMFRHVDYVINLVGPDHVGLGLDIVFDAEALTNWARGRPSEWPMTKDPEWPGFRYAQPKSLGQLVSRMLIAGYPEDAVVSFLGGNVRRAHLASLREDRQ